MVEFLRDRLPKKIEGTTKERNRLVKLGTTVKDLITIVTYRTFRCCLAKDDGR